MQLKDGTIQYTMADYIANRLKAIPITRKILKKNASQTARTADERHSFEGDLMHFVDRSGRTSRCGRCSQHFYLAGSRFPNPTMNEVVETNEVIAHLKAQHVVLKIFPMPGETSGGIRLGLRPHRKDQPATRVASRHPGAECRL